jgi:hypothetical protein
MALQLGTTLRNAMLDAIETSAGTAAIIKIWSGSAPSNCATADSGTKLVEFDLASDWASAASSGAKALSSTPITATAAATGTAGYFRLYDSTPTVCHMQGTVTATGGGGDVTIDSTSIASGQTISITSWSITAPGA